MSMIDLGGLARSSLDKVSDMLDGCLLYLDSGAGEAVAANIGLDYLLSIGVFHVCALETASRRCALLYTVDLL